MQNTQGDGEAEIEFLASVKFPADFAGQQLFIQGPDWHSNAMLGWAGFPWELYTIGYKDAADVLAEALTNRKAPVDSVIYPLVFLYRQGLELELKLILRLARRLNGKEAKKEKKDHEHPLMPLWVELREHLEQLDPRGNDRQLMAMEDFIKQLDAVDSGSFAFRYPTTKDGKVSLPDLKHVNVRHLSEIMDSVFVMLGGIHSWLGEMDQNAGDL